MGPEGPQQGSTHSSNQEASPAPTADVRLHPAAAYVNVGGRSKGAEEKGRPRQGGRHELALEATADQLRHPRNNAVAKFNVVGPSKALKFDPARAKHALSLIWGLYRVECSADRASRKRLGEARRNNSGPSSTHSSSGVTSRQP
jgi:hypothetical protein